MGPLRIAPLIATAATVAAAAFLTALACSSSNTDCTCAVENGSQRRTLVCGESACVGGATFTCGEKDQGVRGGACTVTPTPPDPNLDAGGPPGQPPDRSCEDLRSFCSSSCSKPASASADCQATASTGDPAACTAWPLANGVVCRP